MGVGRVMVRCSVCEFTAEARDDYDAQDVLVSHHNVEHGRPHQGTWPVYDNSEAHARAARVPIADRDEALRIAAEVAERDRELLARLARKQDYLRLDLVKHDYHPRLRLCRCGHPPSAHLHDSRACLHETPSVVWACGCDRYRPARWWHRLRIWWTR